jgi:LuxR family maltose regulon positive regulatory protein
MAIVESKLRPPDLRPGIIPRTALVDRLLTSSYQPVVSAVAPSGYGKTTVLAQWAAQHERDVAWVSIDEHDNDPLVLLTEAAVVLDRIEPIDPRFLRALTSPGPSTASALSRFAPAVSSIGRSVTLVLDHVELLENRESLDVVAELAVRLPTGSQLVVASRRAPPLPTALLRSRGHVAEIGVAELAMDDREARLLFDGAGVQVTDSELRDLVEKTEGWPVGLYLAALASRNAGKVIGSTFTLRGDDRLIGDYLRSEFLARLAPSAVTFLTRTSVLDRLSGPLCDVVLSSGGSQDVLESLEESNLLLVPLDRRREWFRYHHLFRDLLRAELSRNEPALVTILHSRAAAWYEANGMAEAAIDHAQAAGDGERVAHLVTWIAQPTYQAGRAETARRWFTWFTERGSVERYPQISVMAAMLEALQGRPAQAQRWMDAAEAGSFDGSLPDGGTVESWIVALRVLLCPHGIRQMRADAVLAQQLLAPGSPFRAGSLMMEGLSYLLEGEPDRADPIFAQSVDVAVTLGVTPAAVNALAERAVVAIGRNDWDAAQAFCDQAMELVGAQELEGYLESSLAYAVAARLAVHRGDVPHARACLASATRLRLLLTYAIPFTAQYLLEMAKAYLEVADAPGARTVLLQVRDILSQRPDLGLIAQQADELQRILQTIRVDLLGASSLTAAELRLLPLLATHLSYRDIGERLHVSRNTVKTHAVSIYRKLGVSSRSEAIERSEEVGLLAHW